MGKVHWTSSFSSSISITNYIFKPTLNEQKIPSTWHMIDSHNDFELSQQRNNAKINQSNGNENTQTEYYWMKIDSLLNRNQYVQW